MKYEVTHEKGVSVFTASSFLDVKVKKITLVSPKVSIGRRPRSEEGGRGGSKVLSHVAVPVKTESSFQRSVVKSPC
jgi:hypothetical protein